MEEKDINLEETEWTEDEAKSTEEKESTVELREAYEEKSAEEPPKKKRKISKKKLALIIVAGVILLIAIGVGLFFLIGRLLLQDITVVQGEFNNKPPAAESTYTSDEVALINSAMEDGASEATIRKAIALIYNKANSNKINNASQAITVLQGGGSATLTILGTEVSGSMEVRGFKAQAGSEFYYQKAAPIVKTSPEEMQPYAAPMLEQQERTYTDGVNDYRMTGTLKGGEAKILLDDSDHKMEKTIPFVAVGVPKKSNINSYSKEEFYENGFYLNDPREITNFLITEDTVVLNPLKEGEKRIEICQTEDGDQFYVCRFSLLIKGDGHDECVQKARAYLRKSANSTDLEYDKFDVRFEAWTNGYFKMMHDEEIWVGTASGTKTSSNSWYESITYYDFDAEIFNETDAAEYAGENWAAKLIKHYKDEIDNPPKK